MPPACCSALTLKYAHHDGIAWHIATVPIGEEVKSDLSFALDTADRPHIIYYIHSQQDYELQYVYHDGSDWQIDTVSFPNVQRTSLALDTTGRPHVVYHDGDVKHAFVNCQ